MPRLTVRVLVAAAIAVMLPVAVVRAQEPVKGPLQTAIERTAPGERAAERISLLADAVQPLDVVKSGIAIKATKPVADGASLRQMVWAFDADNTLIFQDFVVLHGRVPFMVPDGAGYREDAAAAYEELVTHAVSVATQGGTVAHVPDRIGTVTTFFAEASDGWVSNNDNAGAFADRWEDVKRCLGTITTDDAGTDFGEALHLQIPGQSSGDAEVTMSFLSFDTSSLSDTTNVYDAILSLVSNGAEAGTQTDQGEIEARVDDWTGSGLTTADCVVIDPESNWTALDLVAQLNRDEWDASDGTRNAFAGVPDTGGATFSNSQIDKTGTSDFALLNNLAHDLPDQSAGSGEEIADSFGFYYADETGTTNDPRLVVVSIEPGDEPVPPPDDDIEIPTARVFRHVSELDDILFYVSHNIPYADVPLLAPSETYEMQLLDTDGTTELDCDVPDDGDCHAAVQQYQLGNSTIFSGAGHGLTWESDYTVRVQGVPGVVSGAPNQTYDLVVSDYSISTSVAETAAELKAYLFARMLAAEGYYEIDLVNGSEDDYVLTAPGAAFIDASFPSARDLFPEIFSATLFPVGGVTPTPSSSTYIQDTATQLDNASFLSTIDTPAGLTLTQVKGIAAGVAFFAIFLIIIAKTSNVPLAFMVSTVFAVGGGAAVGFVPLEVLFAIFALLVLGAVATVALKRA
jgi:hypothetical protein